MISATIDIGTNAVLLLIAEYKIPPSPRGGGDLKVLWDEAQITRLGESLHKFHLFIPTARKRTLAVLKEYRRKCDSYQAKEISAVGTAAFRKAENAGEFLQEVEKETGIKIKIISGEREAALSYLSVKKDFGQHPHLYALDIGGGSTELISEEGGTSFDIGGVLLTEKIVRHDPPTDKEIREMKKAIDRAIQFPTSPDQTPTLVGLAGSVTTLSAIKQKLEYWDGARVQGSILTLSDLNRMIRLFRTTTIEEKRKIPGMVHGREDTILAGTLILKNAMEKLGTDQVIVSDRGLRYGLFYERLLNFK